MVNAMEGASYYLEGEERFGTCSSRIYSRFSGMHYWKYYRAIAREVLRHSPESVLDVGCGPGDILAHLAAENASMHLFGVDPSEGMVNAARRNFARHGMSGRISAGLGSSRDIPFNSKFDLIISSISFHHWKDRGTSLENLSRYLTEKGRIIIFDLDRSQFPGKLPLFRRHTLSEEEGKTYSVEGFTTTVTHLHGTGLITLELNRKQAGIPSA